MLGFVQAKRMHISMGIRGIVRRNDQPTEGPYSRVLVLLDKLASIFADPAVTSPSMKAISQALPVRSSGWTRSVLLSCVCAEAFPQLLSHYACLPPGPWHQSSTALLECSHLFWASKATGQWKNVCGCPNLQYMPLLLDMPCFLAAC